MDFEIVGIILAVIVVAVIGTVIYILRTGAKPTQNAAILYQNWTERFGLEPFITGKKAAEHNAKILTKNLKVLWDKKVLEEIDLRPEIEGLTQEHALEFVAEANELFLQKTNRGFVYDIRDAREGNLRLFTLDKDSDAYKNFIFGQAVIKLLRSKAELEQFPDIEFPEGTEQAGLSKLESFVIAQSGISTDPEALYEITSTLTENFGDEWDVFLVSDDVLKFAKAQPEPEEEPEEVEGLSPFAQQKEQKRLAEEAAAAERERMELERRLRWQQAEEEKKQQELAARDEAIAAGLISELVLKPRAFLSQSIEIAADEAGILTLDDEAEIQRTDRIGSPTVFTVYSDDLIDSTGDSYRLFTEALVATLQKNLGGTWSFEPNGEQASSITFTRNVE